jgi:diguanylate cyclase (GGDEF)-like protein
MSFRGRLWLFFALIVIVPMIALAIVLFSLTASSETGKADAAVAQGVRTAFVVHDGEARQVRDDARRVAADPALRRALVDDRIADARARIAELVGGDVEAIEIRSPSGRLLGRAGPTSAVAPQGATIEREDGQPLAVLRVFGTRASDLNDRISALSGLAGTIYRGGRTLDTTLSDAPARSAHGELSEPSALESADGSEYRARIERIEQPGGPPLEMAVLQSADAISDRIMRNRIIIGALLVAFLVLALASAWVIGRALTGQIDEFLAAAKRLARGDFRRPVPIHGKDEFAQLGREFNSMSDQLAGKMEEVERKRGELEETIRRVGEALATGLDRQGVMELAVKQAVDACEAESGRALTLDTAIFNGYDAGAERPDLEEALEAAERAAFAISREVGAELLDALDGEATQPSPERRRAVASEAGGTYALTVVLRHVVGPPEYLGALSIARHGRPFNRTEAELLEYLAGQAVVSIENANLHETVERQAVTDELTGLANVRAFWTVLGRELERSSRFDSSVGLVMIDIDDFKQVNDRYGHQRGDEVLSQVADVLRRLSRDIDVPARYGGEELAVVLPETDLGGAVLLAERMREAIEIMQVPGARGSDLLQVTASFGVAAAPDNGDLGEALVAAADEALYRAKRAGKNRVEVALPAGDPAEMVEPEPSTRPR